MASLLISEGVFLKSYYVAVYKYIIISSGIFLNQRLLGSLGGGIA